MKCVILAGGRGTRIAEETSVRPKPLIEVGGRPILWHIMKIYAAHGVTVEVRTRPGLAGQHLGLNWGAFPAAIERLYNAHLNSPTGTPAQTRVAHFQRVADAAAKAFAAPQNLVLLEEMLAALGGVHGGATAAAPVAAQR